MNSINKTIELYKKGLIDSSPQNQSNYAGARFWLPGANG
jgi:hypothetical protein